MTGEARREKRVPVVPGGYEYESLVVARKPAVVPAGICGAEPARSTPDVSVMESYEAREKDRRTGSVDDRKASPSFAFITSSRSMGVRRGARIFSAKRNEAANGRRQIPPI